MIAVSGHEQTARLGRPIVRVSGTRSAHGVGSGASHQRFSTARADMSHKTLLAAAIALALISGAPAIAQDGAHQYEPDRRHEQAPRNDAQAPPQPGQHRIEQAPGRDQGNEQHRATSQSHQSQSHQPPRHSAEHERRARGAGPNHDFYRGERLSSHYRRKVYVVHDWHGRHLRPPPRGYHWVRTGSDFVLVAIVSGIIAEIVLSH